MAFTLLPCNKNSCNLFGRKLLICFKCSLDFHDWKISAAWSTGQGPQGLLALFRFGSLIHQFSLLMCSILNSLVVIKILSKFNFGLMLKYSGLPWQTGKHCCRLFRERVKFILSTTPRSTVPSEAPIKGFLFHVVGAYEIATTRSEESHLRMLASIFGIDSGTLTMQMRFELLAVELSIPNRATHTARWCLALINIKAVGCLGFPRSIMPWRYTAVSTVNSAEIKWDRRTWRQWRRRGPPWSLHVEHAGNTIIRWILQRLSYFSALLSRLLPCSLEVFITSTRFKLVLFRVATSTRRGWPIFTYCSEFTTTREFLILTCIFGLISPIITFVA